MRTLFLRLLPRRRRELGAALLAEAAVVPAGRQRLAWRAGAVWFLVRAHATGPAGYLLALAGSVTGLLWVDRSPSDIANQVALLTLAGTSFALGLAAPRRAWLPALVLGAAIAVSHVVYLTVGPALPYRSEPPGVAGAATLLVLIVPAAVAAYLGAGARRLLAHAD